MGAGVIQAPFRQVDWPVAFPAEHDGPAPHRVVEGLLEALQTACPVEQSVLPVWHSALMPDVQDAPGVHALQAPTLSQTPPVEPTVQAVATGTRLHVPVVQEWHVPHAVAQQTPATQLLCAHWLLAEHGLPSATVGAQTPVVSQ